MPAPHPSAVSLFLIVPLIAWRVYLRFRRMVGRQKMSRYRPWIHLTLFPMLLVLLGWAARHHPSGIAWLAAAVPGGLLLSVYGLKLTQFEVTPERLYYTPHAPLGIALSLLFVARILYRGVEVYVLDTVVQPGIVGFAGSPVTQAVFGLLAGYYIGYAAGLVRWRWGVLRNRRERRASLDEGV